MEEAPRIRRPHLDSCAGQESMARTVVPCHRQRQSQWTQRYKENNWRRSSRRASTLTRRGRRMAGPPKPFDMQGQLPKRHRRRRLTADLIERNQIHVEAGRRPGDSAGRTALSHGSDRPGADVILTGRQMRILQFLRAFVADNPYPPTVREITRGCGISSTSVTHYNLWVLEQKRYVTRIPGIARGTILSERGRSEIVR